MSIWNPNEQFMEAHRLDFYWYPFSQFTQIEGEEQSSQWESSQIIFIHEFLGMSIWNPNEQFMGAHRLETFWYPFSQFTQIEGEEQSSQWESSQIIFMHELVGISIWNPN